MLLLITGCVNVADTTPFVAVRGKNERLNQYLETLKWAISSSPFDIILFCENSGCDFDFYNYVETLKSSRIKRFEYLSFRGNREECDKKGKGYGEGEIIAYAMEHSQYLRQEKYFYKITGKLKVANIDELITDDNHSYFMRYCDRVGKVDTKFYKLLLSDYNRGLGSVYVNVDDQNGEFLEKVYYEAMKRNAIKYKSFKRIPIIEGVSGTTGRTYQRMSMRKSKLYNSITARGLYNYKWMAYLDYFLNKIHF